MKNNLLWKALFIVTVVLICLLGILGVPNGLSWAAVKEAALNRIHLGLDLQGGTHMILQVHVDDAVNAETDQVVGRLQEDLASKGISYQTISKPDPKARPDVIEIRGIPPERLGDFRNEIENRVGPNYDLRALPGSGNNFELAMKPTALAEERNTALQRSIETIYNRIDALHVKEPTVQQHGLGEYQILVQLPGIDDPARVREILQETAMLEFRLGKSGPFPSEAAALAQYGGVLPEDSVVIPGQSIGASSDQSQQQYYIVSRTSVVTGNDLRDAQPTRNNQTGGWEVNFSLNRNAGRIFGNFTEQHINQMLAAVLDGKVREWANIESRIEDEGRITGRFTQREAQDLALVLRSGALPASVSISEEQVVGPSLGADSIHHGIVASLVGFVLVAGFMLFYYRGAGINAVLALVLNLVILMAWLAYISATLTLPGIAGIILTIGMAVDANVLIFERIREELRHGKSIPSSVDLGFKHAFRTIMDTHVTTVVSAFFLFLFGTGPIKGFAVTLVAGLVANLFTAIFVSRVIFDYELQRLPRGAALSI